MSRQFLFTCNWVDRPHSDRNCYEYYRLAELICTLWFRRPGIRPDTDSTKCVRHDPICREHSRHKMHRHMIRPEHNCRIKCCIDRSNIYFNVILQIACVTFETVRTNANASITKRIGSAVAVLLALWSQLAYFAGTLVAFVTFTYGFSDIFIVHTGSMIVANIFLEFYH